jgi:hypothetical protein
MPFVESQGGFSGGDARLRHCSAGLETSRSEVGIRRDRGMMCNLRTRLGVYIARYTPVY